MGKLGLVKNAFISKGKSILSFLDDYNTAVENGVRVATFRALRNRGMTMLSLKRLEILLLTLPKWYR